MDRQDLGCEAGELETAIESWRESFACADGPAVVLVPSSIRVWDRRGVFFKHDWPGLRLETFISS